MFYQKAAVVLQVKFFIISRQIEVTWEKVMASINDVAKRANVAKSTVSLVLNNNGYVSKETRLKVEKAISELNYIPSQIGRNLSHNRTNLIGIIIPDAAHPFYGSFIKYAEEALYHKGYKTMICATIEKENMEQEFLDMLKSHTMDGIIMGAHSLLQEQYKKLKQPIVAFDRNLGNGIPLVQADHNRGGYLAAEIFEECGCKNIVQVSGARIVNTPAHEYHISFEKALNNKGISVNCIEMPHNAFNEEDFIKTAEMLFDLYPGADGIFGADLLILACIREAARRNKKNQVKFVAYDGTYVTRLCEKTIDAIVQPVKEMSYVCAEIMDILVKGEKLQKWHNVFPVSVQREYNK